MQSANKKPYEAPVLDIVAYDFKDIITASGGFSGEWDENMPQDIDLPKIGF